MYSAYHPANPATALPTPSSTSFQPQTYSRAPQPPPPPRPPPPISKSRDVLTFSLEKYSFSDTAAAAAQNGQKPPSDLNWTHWPQRDGLFLVLDVPVLSETDVQRGVTPRTGTNGKEVRMKVVCGVQTAHDLDVTALISRNVMAEGIWQPAVFLLGRSPCLAVKYTRGEENYCTRFQVRFQKTADYERAISVMNDWGIPVKMRAHSEGRPSGTETSQPSQMDISQFSQQQPQVPQYQYEQYSPTRGQPFSRQIDYDQYRAHSQYHHHQQQFSMSSSQPSFMSGFPQEQRYQGFGRPPVGHLPHSEPKSLPIRMGQQSVMETPRSVRSGYTLPSPPGSAQSFQHPPLVLPPLVPQPTAAPVFDTIEDLDEDIIPPPRPPIAFSKKKSSERSRPKLVTKPSIDPMLASNSVPKSNDSELLDRPTYIDTMESSMTMEPVFKKGNIQVCKPSNPKRPPPPLPSPPSSTSSKPNTAPESIAPAAAARPTPKPKSKPTKPPTKKSTPANNRARKPAAKFAPTQPTPNTPSRKRRKIGTTPAPKSPSNETADEDDDDENGEVAGTGVPGAIDGEDATDPEMERIQIMMAEALQDEEFVGFCEKIGEVWEKMGFVELGS